MEVIFILFTIISNHLHHHHHLPHPDPDRIQQGSLLPECSTLWRPGAQGRSVRAWKVAVIIILVIITFVVIIISSSSSSSSLPLLSLSSLIIHHHYQHLAIIWLLMIMMILSDRTDLGSPDSTALVTGPPDPCHGSAVRFWMNMIL